MDEPLATLPSDDELKSSLREFADPDRNNPMKDQVGKFNWWRFFNIYPNRLTINTGLFYLVNYWWKKPDWPASTKVLLTAGLVGLVFLFIWVFTSGPLGITSRPFYTFFCGMRC